MSPAIAIAGVETAATTEARSAGVVNPFGWTGARVASPTAAGLKFVAAVLLPAGKVMFCAPKAPTPALELERATSISLPPATGCSSATFREESSLTVTKESLDGLARGVVGNRGAL